MSHEKRDPWHGDEHHGQGGSYIVEGGKRRLVERTKEPQPQTEVNKADAAKAGGEKGRK
jgi:hypothetical protein